MEDMKMSQWLNGFTAYTEDTNNCFGLAKVYSNMGDLMIIPTTFQGSYSAEITFLDNNAFKLVSANPLRLTLRNNLETWKLTGTVLSFSDNNLKISLTAVEYYVDDDEKLKWDVFKYIHRINGHDHMDETRKNIGME
jgi:phage tail tube protein FII